MFLYQKLLNFQQREMHQVMINVFNDGHWIQTLSTNTFSSAILCFLIWIKKHNFSIQNVNDWIEKHLYNDFHKMIVWWTVSSSANRMRKSIFMILFEWNKMKFLSRSKVITQSRPHFMRWFWFSCERIMKNLNHLIYKH